ncbi:hypothetical protein AB0F13_16415 [Streptomyces sp. NPDC026206]|uniref:hypothetical protein n=1 Tax=Streptomyces sp. NPDC026206 TaxID=3157089 RepID=UPI0033CBA66B
MIPPESSESAAARLMAAASAPGDHLTASGLIAQEKPLGAAEDDRGRQESWESEGGTAPSSRGTPDAISSPARERR